MEDLVSEHAESMTTIDHLPSHSGVLPYPMHHFRLNKIISEIKLLFYHLPNQMSSLIWPQDLEGCRQRLHHELDVWYTQIESVAQSLVLVDEKDREHWYIKLELHCFAAVVLLFQPSQVFNKPSEEALLLCFKYSARQIESLNRLHERNALHPGWRSVQSIFSSGATMIYCFWTSKRVQRSTEAADLPKLLRMCSNLLTIGGEWWPSAKQGKFSFEKVVDVTLRKLGDLRSGSSSKRSKRPIYDWEPQAAQNPSPTSASAYATGRHPGGAYDTDIGLLSHSSSSMTGFESFAGFNAEDSRFSLDPSSYADNENLDLSHSWGSQLRANLGEEPHTALGDAENGESLSETYDQDQNFTKGMPSSVDLEIRQFLAEFWATNSDWNELGNYDSMSYGFNRSV